MHGGQPSASAADGAANRFDDHDITHVSSVLVAAHLTPGHSSGGGTMQGLVERSPGVGDPLAA